MRTARKLFVAFLIGFVLVVVFPSRNVYAADTTPPTTTRSYSGTAGQDNWYRSNIDVDLSITDSESGVAENTYWIDSGTPVVTQFTTTQLNPFLNNSFETLTGSDIDNWYKGTSGLVLYYSSSFSAHDGSRSAAILFIGLTPTFYYWYNEPYSIELPAGELVEISAWARTLMFSGDYAYFEVWGEDVNGDNDTLLATSNHIEGVNWSWHNATATFTVPSSTNYIYVKLGATGTPAALVYWDQVEVRSAGGTTEHVNFTFSDEGAHTLHYYSEDNDGNVESEHTAPLKIDTVIPNPWQNFTATNGTCNHCYSTSADIQDVTSGVDVSTAEYKYYTEHNGQYWSSWLPVDSVKLISNGQNASDGETSLVELNTGEIDFGDSAHYPFRVQYRICDMAGNCSTSPAYELAAPWVLAPDGSMFIQGEIYLPTPPTGDDTSEADVASDYGSVTIESSTGWIDDSYTHALSNKSQISDVLPKYTELKQRATDLSGAALPTSDGIYIEHGDYDLDATTVKNSWKNADVTQVVIVEGDMDISTDYTVGDDNVVVFLVEGDISVTNQNVENIAGFFICDGTFDSDTTGLSRKTLTVNGSVIALAGFSISRDLGTSGTDNNTNTPAEKFVWQPRYVLDSKLAQYLNNETQHYYWGEVPR